MITFKQFLQEAGEPEKFEDFILKHCKPYMEALDADMEVINSPRFSLYRGLSTHSLDAPTQMVINGMVEETFIKTVRTERIPKDTPDEVSKIVDDIFEEKFGWKPRSQAMFCFTYKNRGGTNDYGAKFRVFPMGELKFVYSARVRDLTYQLSSRLRELDIWPGRDPIRENQKDAIVAAIREFIEEHDYTNENLHKAMMAEGKPEIMISCPKYLAVRADDYD